MGIGQKRVGRAGEEGFWFCLASFNCPDLIFVYACVSKSTVYASVLIKNSKGGINMSLIPAKVHTRLVASVKKFQPILNSAKSKDVNESDTVVIITDVLSELFGYDKYSEITSEFAIKKTFCDLAIKIDGKPRLLIEAKAIGFDLKDDHIRQAVNYGANSGVDWVILTNGYQWKVYKITFGKPVDKELVYEFDLLNINVKKQSDLELLYYVSKEAIGKSILEDFHLQKQALSKFFIGQILLTDSVLESVRRVLRKVSPDVKITNEGIKEVLVTEVFKREILEGEKAEEAKKKITKCLKTLAKKAVVKDQSQD